MVEINLSPGAALTYVSAAVAFVGPLLGPIVGAGANLVARVALQKKISQAEYDFKRLDLVEKALAVERTLADKLQAERGTDTLLAEYRQVISSIAANRAREDAQAASHLDRRRGMRALILPWPMSAVGWFASGVYYTYLFLALAFALALVLTAAGALPVSLHEEPMGRAPWLGPHWSSLYHFAIRSGLFAVIAWAAHSWALRNYSRCRAECAPTRHQRPKLAARETI